MGNPIQSLKIDTNILNVRKDFDELIAHINQSLGKPFDLNINTSQMQNQIKQVNEQVQKMESSVSSGITTKIQSESEKLAKTTEQMQRTLNISLQNLQTKYGSLLPQNEVADLQNAIKNLGGTDLNSLRTNTRDIRLDMSQMTADARESSSALRLANQDAKSFFSTFATDMVKFTINVLSPNIVIY